MAHPEWFRKRRQPETDEMTKDDLFELAALAIFVGFIWLCLSAHGII
jgi:hypothetical protein